jgi:L-alanine-DL-glutamate epimerase-like enolase superfamily enzyme
MIGAMQIIDVREQTVAISRFADPGLPSGGLTTSVVAVVTDVLRGGAPVVGYGFSSFGRYGQSGLIRERFAPRILAAPAADLISEDAATIDPWRVWRCMMTGEKPGGHGERSVAVGTLDMAVWDAAAKIAGLPLYRFLASRLGRKLPAGPRVAVYAGGGYPYPSDDIAQLRHEVSGFLAAGFTHVKIKIGAGSLAEDMKRIEAVLELLPAADRLAVDAMNRYDGQSGLEVAAALAPLGLWWFEDICDPLDFESLAAAKQRYGRPVAAGEALFSLAEAKLLSRYGGLRPAQDILLFDPAQSYGLSHYLEIVAFFEAEGWPTRAFWPHGGHLFSLQVAAALGLGGSEVNPLAFQPFGGLMDGAVVSDGQVGLPDHPGIGIESKEGLWDLFKRALA